MTRRAVQTVLVLKDIIRRFPDVAAPYGGTIQALPLTDLESDEAAAAYLWLRAEMVMQGVADPDGAEPVRAPSCTAQGSSPPGSCALA